MICNDSDAIIDALSCLVMLLMILVEKKEREKVRRASNGKTENFAPSRDLMWLPYSGDEAMGQHERWGNSREPVNNQENVRSSAAFLSCTVSLMLLLRDSFGH